MDNRPIGIFDSGIGGLTVLSKLVKELPNEKYIYIADQKNLPYGNKTIDQLHDYATDIIEYFIQLDAKLVLIPCNTSTANSLTFLKEKYEIPIIGVIMPTIDAFFQHPVEHVLVIATLATIQNNAYEQALLQRDPQLHVQSIATPAFVDMIEANVYDDFNRVCDQYFNSVKHFDAIILGCTHFPYIKDRLERYFNKNITFYDSIDAMTYTVKQFLKDHQIESSFKSTQTCQIYTTGDSIGQLDVAKPFLDFDYVLARLTIK